MHVLYVACLFVAEPALVEYVPTLSCDSRGAVTYVFECAILPLRLVSLLLLSLGFPLGFPIPVCPLTQMTWGFLSVSIAHCLVSLTWATQFSAWVPVWMVH